MINIFPANAKNFSTNGLGVLSDPISCTVTEELNGSFELELEYPVDGRHYKEIKMRRIILAKPNPYTNAQPFRIYAISKPINQVVTVNAAHISYDLSGIPVKPFKATSANDAFTALKNNSEVDNPFSFSTTVTNPGEVEVEVPTSLRSILGNNIQRAYPGEYEFDEYMVYLHPKRGYNRGFKIKYGKNMTDLKQDENISNVCTGIYPFWYGELRDENGELVEKIMRTLPEKIVKVEGTFDFERIDVVDAGTELREDPDEATLRAFAVDYIKKNNVGVPDVNMDVSFIQLSRSAEYSNYTGNETIKLGDIVDVDFLEIGISAESTCVKTVYDAVIDQYENVELGKIASRITTSISESNKEFSDTIQSQKKDFDAVIGTIKIGMAEIDQALIEKADISYLNANFAKITDGYIDNAVIKDGTLGTAKIEDAAITNAKIGKLAVDTANIKDAAITNAKIDNLNADKITAGDISADRISTNVITAVNANIGDATINSAKIGDLNADKITAGDISTDRLTTNVIKAVNASIDEAVIDSAKIGNLSADKITSGSIETERMEANVIKAVNASIEQVVIDGAKIGKLDAGIITTGYLDAERIKAGSIDATKITADTINAIGIEASKVTAEKIESGEIKVGNANITDGSISGAKITNASITNAQIDEAFIVDGYIQNLDASKITSGTIDATRVSINSFSGNLKIQDNTITIKDQNRTRVQIGKNSMDGYGIIVTNSNGEAIFDSDKGVLVTNGLKDNIVSNDKIVDETIASTKLNVDELFVGDNAFINSIKAVEINAANITTGTISNDRIDISGLITFEALDEDLQNVFDVTGDKTYINGGMIAANTIKADKIDLLSGITIKGPDGKTTFAVRKDGSVDIDGYLQSANFDPNKSTGYRITPDGTATLNQARISGEFVMPNAGITNYGATIGNDNLLINSNDYLTLPNNDGLGTTVKLTENGITFNRTTAEHYVSTYDNNVWEIMKSICAVDQEYTISCDVRIFEDSGIVSFFNNTGAVNVKGNEWTRISYTFKYSTDYRIFGHSYGTGLILDYKNVKIESGKVSTPWCPHKNEQFDYTRIWAGAQYNDRDNAPFRVTQKGDVWATNATLSGRLLGDYDNDLIHIHNNEIVINDESVRMNQLSGAIESKNNKHFSKDAYIKFAPNRSMINTDLIFGTSDDKRMEYSNENRTLTLSESAMVQIRSNGSMIENSKTSNHYNAVELYGKSGGNHTIGYWDDAAFLKFCSKGSATHPNGRELDFVFEGSDNRQSGINLFIDGNAFVERAVKSSSQNIEMRSVPNEGWGFYAT